MNKLISNGGDYFAVSTYDAYGNEFTGREEWIIVSDKSLEYLLAQYPETMRAFAPFVFLSGAMWSVFENDYRLKDKFRKQYSRHETKARNTDQTYLQDRWSLETSMAKYEEMMDIIYLRDAWSCLTRIQRRRMRAYFFEDRTIKQIAEMEGVDSKAIRKSISQSKEKMLDYFQGRVPFCPSSVLPDARTKNGGNKK